MRCHAFIVLVAAVSGVLTSASPSVAALVLHVNMDNSEVSGTTVTAETGQIGNFINPGSVTTGLPGVAGEAIAFNGGELDFTGVNLNLSTTFTYAFWVKTAQSSGNSYALQNQGGAQSAVLYNWPSISAGNQLALWSTAGGFTGAPVQLTPDGTTWTHVAWTYDGSNFRAYKDGILQNTTPHIGSHANEAAWRIGGSGATDFFAATFDDFRIYNHALSPTEVEDLVAIPEPGSGILIACAITLLGVVRRRQLGPGHSRI